MNGVAPDAPAAIWMSVLTLRDFGRLPAGPRARLGESFRLGPV